MKEMQNQDIEKFLEMVKGAHTCMLITKHEGAGNLSGRPMGLSKVEEDGTLWFFTNKSSKKAEEIAASHNVAITINNESSNNHLMINGTGVLISDTFKIKQLWSPIMKAWFPLGLDDPDMILIKVVPTEVNYWDSSSSKMVVLFNMLKAIATGKEYAEGEHGTIGL